MTTVNPNATTQVTPSQQSQVVPPGNQTAAANSQPLEKQMLELARREKEVRKMQESMKNMVSLEDLRSRGAQDRNSVLKELGFDDLVQQDANDPIAALKKQIEDMQSQQRAEQTKKEESEYFESLKSKLGEKSDDYELIKTLGYENQVFEALKAHKSQHGEVPDGYEFEVAKQLEDVLFNQISSAATAKKIAALFNKTEEKPNTQARHPLDQSTTLNTSDRASTQTPTDSAPTMSRQQMIENAAKHIKFNV